MEKRGVTPLCFDSVSAFSHHIHQNRGVWNMYYLDFAPSELSFFKVQAEGLFLVTSNVALGYDFE